VINQVGVNGPGGGTWQNEYDVDHTQSWLTRITVTNGTGQIVSQNHEQRRRNARSRRK